MAVTSTPYGVGLCEEGKHPRELTYPAYRCWQQMLQRCYCEETKKRQKSYKHCFVIKEWLSYQVFADWFISQRGHDIGWQLDKDLLANDAIKIYSPDTCILLPEYINKVITVKAKASGLPVGVFQNTNKTAFVARYRNKDGVNTHIGTYSCITKASLAYVIKKQELLDYLANQYKDLLDSRAYFALTNLYIKRGCYGS